MNEDQFTEFLKERFPFKRCFGIGDDCSVEKKGDIYQLVTNDILIENVHFRFKYMTPSEIGFKSIAVNVSDIAAMGGMPRDVYLGLGVPEKLMGNGLKEFYLGIESGCQRWGIELAGGDLSKSEKFFISVTLIGQASQVTLRKNAQSGDLICLSSFPGLASIGFELLEGNSKNFTDPFALDCIKKFKVPEINLKSAESISRYATSMMDVSDGLIIDLNRLLKASDKGADIYLEKLQTGMDFQSFCHKNQINLQEKILSGGEDYCLLFTIPTEKLKYLEKAGIEFYQIGKIKEKTGLNVFDQGQRICVQKTGFDHFADK